MVHPRQCSARERTHAPGKMTRRDKGHSDAAANNNGIILTQPPKIIPPQPATKP
jgi:hypothetical protein